MERLDNFLRLLKESGESALIFLSSKYNARTEETIKNIFSGVKIDFIKEDLSESAKIDRLFGKSLREGSLLVIYLDPDTPPVVMRRLEQIFEDGYIQTNTGRGFRKVEPVEGWRTLVIINRDRINENEFALRRLFTRKLVVG